MELAELEKALRSQDEAVRLEAVNATLEAQCGQMDTLLVKQLEFESSHFVREAIVFVLQHKSCPESYPSLFALFRSDDAFLRNAAMGIFGSGGKTALFYLRNQSVQTDREVRKLILDALVQIGTPEAVEIIRYALFDPAPNVRITAADYLGQLDDADSVDTMLDLFSKDTEPMFRATVLESVASMSSPEVSQKLIDFYYQDTIREEDNPIYLPILLRFAGRIKNVEYLITLLARLRALFIYADDVVQACSAVDPVENTPKNIIFFEALRSVAADTRVSENVRFLALCCLKKNRQPYRAADLRKFLATFSDEEQREAISSICS